MTIEAPKDHTYSVTVTWTGSRFGDTQIEKVPSSAASAASAATWASVASGLSSVWSTVRASVSRVQVTRSR